MIYTSRDEMRQLGWLLRGGPAICEHCRHKIEFAQSPPDKLVVLDYQSTTPHMQSRQLALLPEVEVA